MTRCSLLAVLVLFGCDELLANNPGNCVFTPSACGPDASCNPMTQRCETLDCTLNAGLCTSTQSCSSSTHRCEVLSFVLGQPDIVSNLNAAYGMKGPWTAALSPNPSDATKTRLFIGDNDNGRVLMWNDVPTTNRPADLAFGMPSVHTLSVNGAYDVPNEFSLAAPWSLSVTGDTLIVGDYGWSRILIWSQLSRLVPGPLPLAATSSWGQSAFDTVAPNNGQTSASRFGVSQPKVYADPTPGGAFFVADSSNHRVLLFSTVPTGPTTSPIGVVGQTDFFTSTAGLSQSKLNTPRGLVSDGNQLFVTDSSNHRVLSFALTPGGSKGALANGVWGQGDYTSGQIDRGGLPTDNTMAGPLGLSRLDQGGVRRLFVADSYNNRVLGFDLPSTRANLVLGQADFSSYMPNRAGAVTTSTMSVPTEVWSDGKRLVVTDNGNRRVLIWSPVPQGGENGRAADIVLGQPDGTSSGIDLPPATGALQFQSPTDVVTDGTHLVVSDSANHRVLLWLSMPRSGATPPDVVLGQTGFTSLLPNRGQPQSSSATLASPAGVTLEGGKLAVADQFNNRVLIWNQLPTQSGAPADVVLGQTGFGAATSGVSQTQLNQPGGVRFVPGQSSLYVSDQENNRVLRFDAPYSNGQTAALVLGQANFNTAKGDPMGVTASSLSSPHGIWIEGSRLLIADSNHDRVLLWNNLPTQNSQAADVAIGQPNFTSAYSRVDRVHVHGPYGVSVHNGRLYVTSLLLNRILYWNQIPTANGTRADGVLGQPDFLSAYANHGDVPAIERLSAPIGMSASADQLFIADSYNHRVVVRAAPP